MKAKSKKFWIARDNNGENEVWGFNEEPFLDDGGTEFQTGGKYSWGILPESLKELLPWKFPYGLRPGRKRQIEITVRDV